jgi:pimeloyl-ACP methyl ester carboxylesterase
LPELAKNHRVIAFDRPGYGYSERQQGDWQDPAQIAALLLDACNRLGIQKPVIVGHSWAGSVVMAALVEMPARISGGVLLAGVAGHWAGSVGWTYDVGAIPVLGPLFAWTVVTPAGQLLLPEEVQPVLAPSPVPDHYVEDIGAPLALRPWSFEHNVEDMTRLNVYMQNLSPRYDQIRLPLLIIHGDADRLVPFWNHGRRVLPVVPQARLVLIHEAGHALHHTHTQEVARAIDQFVSPVTPARRIAPTSGQ